ncbi:hypothetical protein SOVF_008640 [Spinacia oleracea]|uniref:Uncharacterized protein isoform X2 n=1 Tax=Spinacia oleracea TaxID=3562 RepID=A0A9R0KCB6_SPIOL|nr:uncharacterized protein LOC110805083 isoform X2 [Spinacia oleracea]KNA25196.1 hypothetical protein SOVF_008640 [Spinacia oleracea]
MAAQNIIQNDKDLLLYTSIFGDDEGGTVKSRGALIEKKIEMLEGLASNVGNRRSRRLLNDRLLMELVPRLNAEEIRGLFAPPPWGEEVPLSSFCMANVGDWDKVRNTDMDKEASILESIRQSSQKRKTHVDADKTAVMNAWHKIDCRTREAFRRSFLPELIEGYENRIRAFIGNGNDSEVLLLQVQDPFHRLLLHGVCEFYDLISVTETQSRGSKSVKTTKIQKKKSGPLEIPSLTLSRFLKMSKEGIW